MVGISTNKVFDIAVLTNRISGVDKLANQIFLARNSVQEGYFW